jgi:hypothetical protein
VDTERQGIMSDPNEFSWSNVEEVVKSVNAIAVYSNPHGDVVIRQAGDNYPDPDQVIVIPRGSVKDVIAAMRKETGE